MKISKLHIDQFRHLENLDFDFTYPEDFHIEEKRGKPLDKICFIGQSATGKTGLLELVFDSLKSLIEAETIDNKFIAEKEISFSGEVNFLFNESSFKFKNNEIYFENQKYIRTKLDQVDDSPLKFLIPEDLVTDFFYFKANLITDANINIFTNNPIELIEKNSKELKDIANYYANGDYGLVFDNNADSKIWLYLIHDILEYRKNFTQKMSELIHKGLIADPKKLGLEFQKWKKDNPNELDFFAEKFNPILKKLNLEVDLINTEYSIPIKNKKNGEIIPIQNTSTGTKGLLLSFLPLFKFDTKNSIIIIDEPERSLYPDMQMDLMDYYKNLAPEAQFIIATHSPFIAASFEPDERFILYFDEKGKVSVRRGSSPIGDDPNDMLKNDFNLESLMNEKGVEAFERYRSLKKLLASEKNEDKKDKLLEEILSLANAYKF
jgi:hypothetical protein